VAAPHAYGELRDAERSGLTSRDSNHITGSEEQMGSKRSGQSFVLRLERPSRYPPQREAGRCFTDTEGYPIHAYYYGVS